MKNNIFNFPQEIKIVLISNIVFSLSVIIILVFTITYLKKVYEISLFKETNYIIKSIQSKTMEDLPNYIAIYPTNFLGKENCFFIPQIGKYLCINKSLYFRPLYIFSIFIFFVASVFFLIQFLVTYFLIRNLVENNLRINYMLETIILGISHKFGNIVSSQKVIIELLKNECKSKYILRLENVFKLLEKDLKSILNFIKLFNIEKHKIEKIDIVPIIEKLLKDYKSLFPEKNINFDKSQLENIYVKGNREELENLFTSLIENAFLHSKNYIKVKITIYRGVSIFCIVNDINNLDIKKKHSGIGYVLIEGIAKRYNYKLKKRIYKDFFIVCIKFS